MALRRPAVLHVGGWCGHGVALALASGGWVASLLLDGAAPQDLPWFRPAPPRVPGELSRRLALGLTVSAMSLLTHLT